MILGRRFSRLKRRLGAQVRFILTHASGYEYKHQGKMSMLVALAMYDGGQHINIKALDREAEKFRKQLESKEE